MEADMVSKRPGAPIYVEHTDAVVITRCTFYWDVHAYLYFALDRTPFKFREEAVPGVVPLTKGRNNRSTPETFQEARRKFLRGSIAKDLIRDLMMSLDTLLEYIGTRRV